MMRLALASLLLCGGAFAGTAQAQETATGETLFGRRCSGCHSLDKEKESPRLRDVYGRKVASVPGFPYSDALKTETFVWNAETLERWLKDPSAVVPDTEMDFRVPDPLERSLIIGYLKHLRQP